MLTGRDLVVMDDSLIGEMCQALHCGYPLLSVVAAAFPTLRKEYIRSAHLFDFKRQINGEIDISEVLVRADGSKLMSGWYLGNSDAMECIARITGCDLEDSFCHDRYALQRLVRGPFNSNVVGPQVEKRMIGVPANLRHAMISLPHAYAPRLDAAIHLRTQFQSFEQSIGSDDGAAWTRAIQERDAWLNCTAPDCGKQLFQLIATRLQEELPSIRGLAVQVEKRRRKLLAEFQSGLDAAMRDTYSDRYASPSRSRETFAQQPQHPGLGNASDYTQYLRGQAVTMNGARARRLPGESSRSDASSETTMHNALTDEEEEKTVYIPGGADGKIYVYIASDNEAVKEAMAAYLKNHANIAVMRIQNNAGTYVFAR